MNKRKKTGMYLGKVMCKFAETFAPQASELCRGQYYQPKEPDNMNMRMHLEEPVMEYRQKQYLEMVAH